VKFFLFIIALIIIITFATLIINKNIIKNNKYFQGELATNKQQQNLSIFVLPAIPIITIISPQNRSYSTSIIDLKFTVNESTFWSGYRLDNGEIITSGNTSLTALSSGTHHLIVYANDSAGNINSSEVYFTVNITPPVITILSPEPKNYPIEKLWLNVTADIPVNNWWYNLNSGSNTTFTPNTTINVAQCSNNLIVYVNSSGNIGFSNISFNALTGDVDKDKDVDIFDVVLCSGAYGSKKGETKYKPECDINQQPDGDGFINIFDIVVLAGKYGKKC
jgi:hypothetical protein